MLGESITACPGGDAELLRFLIEHKSVAQAEAAVRAGEAESTISELLAGKRKLNRRQIAKLVRYFHVASSCVSYQTSDSALTNSQFAKTINELRISRISQP
jgi:transcriptional regulator with XRE-family HTH domain